MLLSPFLFLLVIDWILKTATSDRRNGIEWTQLDDLDFADDLALLSHNHNQMQDMTTCLAVSLKAESCLSAGKSPMLL